MPHGLIVGKGSNHRLTLQGTGGAGRILGGTRWQGSVPSEPTLAWTDQPGALKGQAWRP